MNILMLTLIVTLSMTACGKDVSQNSQDSQENPQEASQETQQEIPKEEVVSADNKENGSVDKGGTLFEHTDESSVEYKAEDGTVILNSKTEIPVVDITYNEEAAKAINDYFKTNKVEEKVWEMSLEESVKWAKEDYESRSKAVGNWNAYELDTSYSVKRLDDAVVSFVTEGYSYMGGAHPNTIQAALNFDTQTGKKLMLSDAVMDETKAKQTILENILQQTKQEQYKGMFFENYEEHLSEILTEDTWYLGKDGFHVIGNHYLIAPYAAGGFDFIIPYEQADFLNEKYRMS